MSRVLANERCMQSPLPKPIQYRGETVVPTVTASSSRGRFVRYAPEEGCDGNQVSTSGIYVQDVPFQSTATKSQIGPHSMSLLEKRVGPLELSDPMYYPSRTQSSSWHQCSPSSRIVSSQLSSSAYSFGNNAANIYPLHHQPGLAFRASNQNVRSPVGPVSWDLSKSMPTPLKRVTSGEFSTRELPPAQYLSASPLGMKNAAQIPAYPMRSMVGSAPMGVKRPGRSSRTATSPAISLREISGNYATHSPVSHQTSISAIASDNVPSPVSSRRAAVSRLQRRQATSGSADVRAEPLTSGSHLSLSQPLTLRRMKTPQDFKSLMVILHDFQWTPGYFFKRGLAEEGCYHCKITLGSTLALRTRTTTTLVDSVKSVEPSRTVSAFAQTTPAPLLFSTVMVLPYHEENFLKIGIVKVNRVEKVTLGLCRLDTHTLIGTGQDLFGGDVPMVGGDCEPVGTLKVNMAFLETAHVAAFASCAGIMCPSGPALAPAHSRTPSQASERKKAVSSQVEMSGQFHSSSLSENSESPRPPSAAEESGRPYKADTHALSGILETIEARSDHRKDKTADERGEEAEDKGVAEDDDASFAGQMKHSAPGRPVKLNRNLRVQDGSGSSGSSQHSAAPFLAESRRGRQLSQFADEDPHQEDRSCSAATPRSDNGDVVICRVVQSPTKHRPEEAAAATVRVPPVASFVTIESADPLLLPSRSCSRRLGVTVQPARVWRVTPTHRVDLVTAPQEGSASSKDESPPPGPPPSLNQQPSALSKSDLSSSQELSSASRSWVAKRGSTPGSDIIESNRVVTTSPVSDKMWSSVDTALTEGGLLHAYQTSVLPQGEDRRFLERVKVVMPQDGQRKSSAAARQGIDGIAGGQDSAQMLSSAESSVVESSNSSNTTELLACKESETAVGLHPHPHPHPPLVWPPGCRSSDGEEGRGSMKSGKSWHSRASDGVQTQELNNLPDLSLDETDSASNVSPCQRIEDEKGGEPEEDDDEGGAGEEEDSPTQVMLKKSARDPAGDFAKFSGARKFGVGKPYGRASDSRNIYRPAHISTNLDPNEAARRDGSLPYFLSCQNTPSAEALLSYRFLGTNIPPLKDSFLEDESYSNHTEESPCSQKTRIVRCRRLFSLPPHFDSFDPYDSDSKNPIVFNRRPLNHRIDQLLHQNEEKQRPRTLLGRSRTMTQRTHVVECGSNSESEVDTTTTSLRNTLETRPTAQRVPLCEPNFIPNRSTTLDAFADEENLSISLKSSSGTRSPDDEDVEEKDLSPGGITIVNDPISDPLGSNTSSNTKTEVDTHLRPTSSQSSIRDEAPDEESPILKYSKLQDPLNDGCSRLLAEYEAVQSVREEVDQGQTPSSFAPNPQALIGSQVLSSMSSLEEATTAHLAETVHRQEVMRGPILEDEGLARPLTPEVLTVSQSSGISIPRTESLKDVFETLQRQYPRAQSLMAPRGPADAEDLRGLTMRINMRRSWTQSSPARQIESDPDSSSNETSEDELTTDVQREVFEFLRPGGSLDPHTVRHGGQSISSKGGRTSEGGGSKTLEILLSFQPEGSVSQRRSCRGDDEDFEDYLSEVMSRRGTIELKTDFYEAKSPDGGIVPSLKLSRRTLPLGASQKLAMAMTADSDLLMDELTGLPEEGRVRTEASAGNDPLGNKVFAEPDREVEPFVKVAVQLCENATVPPFETGHREASLSTLRDEFSSWKDSSNVDSATTEICSGEVRNPEASAWQAHSGSGTGGEELRETPRLSEELRETPRLSDGKEDAASVHEPELLAVTSFSDGKLGASLKSEDQTQIRLSLMSSGSRSLGGLVSLKRQESLPSGMSAAQSDYCLPSFLGSVDDSLEVCPAQLGLGSAGKESFPPIRVSAPGGLSRTESSGLTCATREESPRDKKVSVRFRRSQTIKTTSTHTDEGSDWVFSKSPGATTTSDDSHPLDLLLDSHPLDPTGPHSGATREEDAEEVRLVSNGTDVVALEPTEESVVSATNSGPVRKDTDPSSLAASDQQHQRGGSPKFLRRFNTLLGMRAASATFPSSSSDVAHTERGNGSSGTPLSAGPVLDSEVNRSIRGISEDNSAVHKKAGFKRFWR